MVGDDNESRQWEEIEHTADWSIRVWGSDLRELFEHAARGMLSLLGGSSTPDGQMIHHTIDLEAPDNETLLVDWLSELVWLIEDKELFFTSVEVAAVADLTIHAEVEGKPNAEYGKHIKAITYHNLSIRETEKGYETTIIFDV